MIEMTPPQKANDLVNQYRILLMNEDTDCGNEILCTMIAIKSAKIAVNEIMKSMYNYYWIRVLIELDKM